MKKLAVDRSWSLLLDRDGVINRKIEGSYVTRWEELEFLPNALAGLAALAPVFGRIVVTTNQRGVARGLVDEYRLAELHATMIEEIRVHGGRIDGIYHCPHDHADRCDCRKPAVGLALAAKRDFPSVEFDRAVVVGDSPSDMEFGRRLGCVRVLVGDSAPAYADYRVADLLALSYLLELPE